jgi:preprotein translocase subunit SecD
VNLRAVAIGAVGTVLVVVLGVGGDAGAGPKHEINFRPVLVAGLPPSTGASADPAAATTVAGCDADAVVALIPIPTTKAADDDPQRCVVLADQRKAAGGKARYYLGPAGLRGNAIAAATYEFVPGQGWTIKLRLTKSGSKAWDALAEQQFHRQVAVVLDHAVVSAPQIQPGDETFSSFNGTAVISGNFSKSGAKALAQAIRR